MQRMLSFLLPTASSPSPGGKHCSQTVVRRSRTFSTQAVIRYKKLTFPWRDTCTLAKPILTTRVEQMISTLRLRSFSICLRKNFFPRCLQLKTNGISISLPTRLTWRLKLYNWLALLVRLIAFKIANSNVAKLLNLKTIRKCKSSVKISGLKRIFIQCHATLAHFSV